MRYVLFSEDPNTHKEVYVRGIDPFETGAARVEKTRDVAQARDFPDARTAYEYGKRYRLFWWKVGQR